MNGVVTVVLRRDGLHHLTLPACSREDAERWAQEGYHVFFVAASGRRWAMNHVNSGSIMTSDQAGTAAPAANIALPHNPTGERNQNGA